MVKTVDRTMSKYTEGDWARITKRQKEIFDKFISLMDRDPADPDVQSAVEEWRQHITDNFYDCTPEILRGLGEMYVSDSRFTESIDNAKPGLADFMSRAIRAYCDKH
ncbi:MAG: TipAS antibiotic-recognition domain-containing protein [Bacillota bacterium]|nr:TipAS antibiotic-recognition domain-containing protein [Bacillota bacterium]HPZ54778.1 TipAS antibiotic-recognition domain-containing protein [Bacillota bacterium]HQD18588.1 TipAS antibiotic-recognition domain-containing protein [Bacillota bacterium]